MNDFIFTDIMGNPICLDCTPFFDDDGQVKYYKFICKRYGALVIVTLCPSNSCQKYLFLCPLHKDGDLMGCSSCIASINMSNRYTRNHFHHIKNCE